AAGGKPTCGGAVYCAKGRAAARASLHSCRSARITTRQVGKATTMRLTDTHRNHIQRIAHDRLGVQAEIFVFGSRTDDSKRGGDVDLYIESPQHITLSQRAALKLALEQTLSLPVDITTRQTGKPATPFQAIARAGAQQLRTPTP